MVNSSSVSIGNDGVLRATSPGNILQGNRQPVSSDGADGDFWIYVTYSPERGVEVGRIVGPKKNGSWPLPGIELVTGSRAGKVGLGNIIPTPTTGRNGDYWLQVLPKSVRLFGPKIQGSWPSNFVELVAINSDGIDYVEIPGTPIVAPTIEEAVQQVYNLTQTGLEELRAEIESATVKSKYKLYVDSEASPINDAWGNDGQDQNKPFRRLERAYLEAARLSKTEEGQFDFDKVLISMAPGTYVIDNRPGKTLAELEALKASDEWSKILNVPASYNRYQDAAALIGKNAIWIINQAYSLVRPEYRSNRCKRDLSFIVDAIQKDLSEMGNKNSVVAARSYRAPDGTLRYVDAGQAENFRLVVNAIRDFAILAVKNQGQVTDSSIAPDTINQINPCEDVQFTIATLAAIVTNALNTDSQLVTNSLNPWKIEINSGIFGYLHYFNAPRYIVAEDGTEVNNKFYSIYRDGATLVSKNKDWIVQETFNNVALNVFTGTVQEVAAKIDKCKRDFGLIIDAIVEDLETLGNAKTVETARIYRNQDGDLLYLNNTESAAMAAAMTTMSARVVSAIKNEGSVIDSNIIPDTNSANPCSSVQAAASSLVNIVRSTVLGNADPWAIAVNNGVRVMSGGVVVPRGISFVGPDLRKVEIRPLYLGEDDLNFRHWAPIFKVTGGVYSYGYTFKDHPGVSWSHHKVVPVVFASDDFEMKPGSPAYYYAKVGRTFYDDPNFFDLVPEETQIVGPAGELDRGLVDTTLGSSPYIYNCSVRSNFGMNGMWADGARVTGLKSMVTAQYTQTSLQRDRRAYEKWSSASKCWVPLGPGDNYYSSKPANYVEYIHSQSDPKEEPDNGDVRYKKGWRHFGFRITNEAFIQVVSCFCICTAEGYVAESGGDISITNSDNNFGETALVARGYRKTPGFVDTDFIWKSIIPPRALTRQDIVRFKIATIDTETTKAYFLATGNRDRIFVDETINTASIEPFTLKVGTNIHLQQLSTLIPATLAPVSQNSQATFSFEISGPYEDRFFFKVDPAQNSILPPGVTAADIDTLAGSSLYIRRLVDRRTADEKVYRIRVEANSAGKRQPPTGFVINNNSNAIGSTGRVFWIYKSVEDFDNPGEYILTLLGLKQDASAQTEKDLIPLTVDQYDVEPLVDSAGIITQPEYNPERSSTRRVVKNILRTAEIGFTAPDTIASSWQKPSTNEVLVDSVGNTTIGSASIRLQFHRPSIIRCGGHTLEYVGYLNYSQGLPQYQTANIPTLAKLGKYRKNLSGGQIYWSGLDDQGNEWVGDSLTNLATGETQTPNRVQSVGEVVTVPLFNTLDVTDSITVGTTATLTADFLSLPSTGRLVIAGIPTYFASAPFTTGTYPLGTLIYNTLPSKGEPVGWRNIPNPAGGSPARVWEPFYSGSFESTYEELIVTKSLTTNSLSATLLGGTLSVTGTSALSGAVTVSANATFSGSGSVVAVTAGTLTVNPSGTSSTIDNVVIGGTTPRSVSATTFTSSGAASVNSLAVTAGATIGGTLAVTGSTTVGSLTASSITTSGAASVGSLAVSGATAVSGALTVSGASTFTGNVTASNGTQIVTLTPQTVTVAPSGSTSTINNVTIGGTTPRPISGTTITGTGAATLNSLSITTNATVSGNLTVNGNFTLNGSSNVTNTITQQTTDPVLDIGGGASGAPLTVDDGSDRGLLLTYYDAGAERKAFAGMINDANDYFTYYRRTVLTNENKVNAGSSTLGDIVAANFRGNVVGNVTGDLTGNASGAITASTLTVNGAATISPASGVVTIAPTAAGFINNMSIGGTTAASGRFTTLAATGAVTLSPANFSVTIAPTGTGTLVINPAATVGSIDRVNIGATTPGTGAFSSLTVNGTALLTGGTLTRSLLPVATSTLLGAVKAGSGVAIAGDGTISVTGGKPNTIQVATQTYTAQAVGANSSVTTDILTALPVGSVISWIKVNVPTSTSTPATLTIGEPGSLTRYADSLSADLSTRETYVIYPIDDITTNATISLTLSNPSGVSTNVTATVHIFYSTYAN